MSKKSGRPSWFKMFIHQKALIDSVPDEAVGRALKAVFAYFDNGELPDLDNLSFAVFASIKPYVDESFDDFQRMSVKNRANVKQRWAKGDTTRTSCNDSIPPHTKNTEAEAEVEVEADTEE